MNKLFVYVGLSASGKTTIAYNRYNAETDIVVDSDEVRQKLFNDATYQGNNDAVFKHMRKLTVKALNEGKTTHFVATNLSSKKRIAFIQDIRAHCSDTYICCVLVATPMHELYQRNEARERHVPEYVIDKQLRAFQCPYMGEGWDDIEVVYNGLGSEEWIDEMWKKVRSFGSQNNPHHSLTLYGHLQECINKMELWPMYRGQTKGCNTQRNAQLLVAAALHDIGKTYTRTIDENGIAHYYGHEGYSSYIALCMQAPLYAVQLISYHMILYTNSEAALEKWHKRFGDYMWDDLMKLHAADKAAK